MLDSDLAMLYNCINGTKEINQAVKNNIKDLVRNYLMKRVIIFWSKNFDQKVETRGGKYKNPRVFTEQGVAMLATIIKSKVATEVSKKIMDVFVEMRRYITTNNYEKKLSNKLYICKFILGLFDI